MAGVGRDRAESAEAELAVEERRLATLQAGARPPCFRGTTAPSHIHSTTAFSAA